MLLVTAITLGFISCDNGKSKTFDGIWSGECEKIHFKSDGTLEYYDTCFEGYDSKGHYTLKGNKLTLVYDDSGSNSDVDVFTVKERTSTQIVLEGEGGYKMIIILTQK